jgi:dolichol-phosphate mannosyltransferase
MMIQYEFRVALVKAIKAGAYALAITARKLAEEKLVSVVLGTYNERENLSKLVPEIETILAQNDMKSEIVVVDDNSPDGTSDLVRELGSKYGNVRLLWRPSKMGPGSAHAEGYKAAKGEIVVGMDTDFSHDPNEIPRFIRKIREGYDIVLASRYIEGGKYEVNSFQTWRKMMASRVGNVLISFLSRIPAHDFTTSLRAIRREVIQNVKTESPGNSFFMEFVIKAYRNGFTITELPIVFKDRVVGKSKLKLGRQSLKMLGDLLKLCLWT